MKLPNGHLAVIDLGKLTDYCLNLDHSRGKHKARVFKRVLGMTADDSAVLRDALTAAARDQEAVIGASDVFGTRFIIDFELTRFDRVALIRSCWIVRRGEAEPRFVTCFIL